MTEYLAADSGPARERSLERAAALLREGRLVAIPTETVYGLAADATSEAAVAAIFAAKGRPPTNPLIVHVADGEQARQWAATWPPEARALAAAFWPGPLTMVLPAAPGIAPAVLAGGTTVGLRAPSQPLALELLRRLDFPLAAPSANPSNAISPTSAAMVLEGLRGRIDAVLDGGPCQVGIESTVLALGEAPVVLRPGSISRAAIARVLARPVGLLAQGVLQGAGPIPSPGLSPRHYAPRTPLRLIRDLPERAPQEAVLLALRPVAGGRCVVMSTDPAQYARALYGVLREADQMGAPEILVEEPPAEAAWEAVRDRLRRAAAPHHPA